jgi:SAM-dependent methyltransferase
MAGVARAEHTVSVGLRGAATAEESGLDAASVDLVTVAQALHWFDLAQFYAELRHVLKPGGIFAATAYKLAMISPEIDLIVNHYYSDVVGPYWPAERALVEEFEELRFAFPEIETPEFAMVANWNVEQLLGYLRTWSATQRFIAAEKRDPLGQSESQLRGVWGDDARRVIWPLTIRVGRV